MDDLPPSKPQPPDGDLSKDSKQYSNKLTMDLKGRYTELCGPGDSNLRLLEELLTVSIYARGNLFTITGEREAVERATKLLEQFGRAVQGGHSLRKSEVRAAVANQREPEPQREDFDEVVKENITVTAGRIITPRTAGQKKLIQSFYSHDIVLAIGPAGTGKTFLSVAMGLSYLHRGLVSKLVLARPAVEAGESLGFLPGAPEEKIAPYLRPLYDSLYAMLKRDRVLRLIENGIIEIVPLAYMRGRTLEKSFVILDEAQNCTHGQLKMFLTRLGVNSRAVVVGDITQIDLPDPARSGLMIAEQFLPRVKGLDFIYLTKADIVRHGLVARIVDAYERFDTAQETSETT